MGHRAIGPGPLIGKTPARIGGKASSIDKRTFQTTKNLSMQARKSLEERHRNDMPTDYMWKDCFEVSESFVLNSSHS